MVKTKKMTDGKKALKQIKTLKTKLSLEKKFFRKDVSVPSQGTTVTVTNMVDMPLGSNSSSREGNQVKLADIKVKGNMRQNTGSATLDGGRVAIVRDNFGTTDVPAVTDIWNSESDFNNGGLKRQDTQALKRFTVLYDQRFIFDPNHGPAHRLLNYSKSSKTQVRYSGINITDEGKNTIYFFSGCTNDAEKAVLDMDSAVHYYDN